jgi:hypothetical protein
MWNGHYTFQSAAKMIDLDLGLDALVAWPAWG